MSVLVQKYGWGIPKFITSYFGTEINERLNNSQMNRVHVNPLFYFLHINRVSDSDEPAEVRPLIVVPRQLGEGDNCGGGGNTLIFINMAP